MQICPKCHKTLSDGARFCGFCSSPIPVKNGQGAGIPKARSVLNLGIKKPSEVDLDDEVTHVVKSKSAIIYPHNKDEFDSQDNTLVNDRQRVLDSFDKLMNLDRDRTVIEDSGRTVISDRDDVEDGDRTVIDDRDHVVDRDRRVIEDTDRTVIEDRDHVVDGDRTVIEDRERTVIDDCEQTVVASRSRQDIERRGREAVQPRWRAMSEELGRSVVGNEKNVSRKGNAQVDLSGISEAEDDGMVLGDADVLLGDVEGQSEFEGLELDGVEGEGELTLGDIDGEESETEFSLGDVEEDEAEFSFDDVVDDDEVARRTEPQNGSGGKIAIVAILSLCVGAAGAFIFVNHSSDNGSDMVVVNDNKQVDEVAVSAPETVEIEEEENTDAEGVAEPLPPPEPDKIVPSSIVSRDVIERGIGREIIRASKAKSDEGAVTDAENLISEVDRFKGSLEDHDKSELESLVTQNELYKDLLARAVKAKSHNNCSEIDPLLEQLSEDAVGMRAQLEKARKQCESFMAKPPSTL